MIKITFNERLRKFFKDNHLNQSSVARDMHIDASKLNAVINGKRKMEVEEYMTFCNVVNIDPGILWENSTKKSTNKNVWI